MAWGFNWLIYERILTQRRKENYSQLSYKKINEKMILLFHSIISYLKN